MYPMLRFAKELRDELLRAGGTYAELWARQANERREEEETDAEIAE